MSEGGADQLSPCQALPKTINPTILYYANHQEVYVRVCVVVVGGGL